MGLEDTNGYVYRPQDTAQMNPPDVTLPPITVTGQRPPPESVYNGSAADLPIDTSTPFDFSKLFDGAGKLFGGLGLNANSLPFLLSAWNDWKNSDRYMNKAEEYAGRLDPFGQQRAGYQDILKKSYTDPDFLKNDPALQSILKVSAANTGAADAAKGFLGSGRMMQDIMEHGQDLSAKYLADEQNRLATLSGAQFGPQAAASMLETGLKGSIDARNNALANLAGAFKDTTTHPVGGPGGTTITFPQGTPKDVQDIIKTAISRSGPSGLTPAGYASMVQQLVQRGYTPEQAQQFIREGQSGDANTVGNDSGNPTAEPGGGLQPMPGGGFYDTDTGTIYDANWNVSGNIYDGNGVDFSDWSSSLADNNGGLGFFFD